MAQALVVNSGNANACTSEQGMMAAKETSHLVADGVGIPDEAVQVASTGVIGVQMPMERIRTTIPGLIEGLSNGTLDDVAEAIMTTDTFPKIEVKGGAVGGISYCMKGIAKGAGMIMPNMATMLSFIITDALVDQNFLEKTFRHAVDTSFNIITVDGDMSTNDTCLIMANGMAANPVINDGTPEAEAFASLLHEVLLSLAKKIVKDGEGATKFAEIRVTGARSPADAKMAAMSIANSCLVKTAFFGQDANWGRIFMAVGASGAEVDQTRLSLSFDDVCMARDGVFAGGDAEARGSEVLRKKEFCVSVDMALGNGSATVYTSDLSHEYVSINADYRT
jgi:glutamate N-acetyltransferase / amino-acid N-acetyltransferase